MSDETTTDRLAEIEGQAADYPPPEGWRVLRAGEMIQAGDRWVRLEDGQLFDARRIGEIVRDSTFFRRMEPEPEPEPEPQPVQVREGRWRTRNGDIRNIIPIPAGHSESGRCSWHDAHYYETWYPSGQYSLTGEHPLDLVKYLGPIQPEPEQTITPDDVAAEALAGVNEWPHVQTLQRKLETTEAALLEQQQQNERLVTQGSQQRMQIAELQAQVAFLKNRELTLGTRLEEEKAVTTKRLQQVEELRSEVSHVQRLWGESRRRVEELETLVGDLRNINATAEKSVEAAARDKADLQNRLDVVAADWALQAGQISGLQTQLEAVKAESAKRLETIQELRSEVSQVHRQWGDSRWRVEELEQKLAEAQPQPVHLQPMVDSQAETIARRNSEIHELNIDIVSLEAQLETVKAELAQVSRDRYLLQIELDAREQVPQAVSDRFEEGWDKGTARAVETIAEWTEAFRTCGSQGLSYHVMQNLPHIMRTLTGLADED